MAKLSGEVDISATAGEILDVLVDFPTYPVWSAVHKRAAVVSRHPDGSPCQATMAVSAAGLIDEQILEYIWTDHGMTWTLVKSGQQRHQNGRYTISDLPNGSSHVRYDLEIVPSIPMLSIVTRQIMKKAVTCATEGLKGHLESK